MEKRVASKEHLLPHLFAINLKDSATNLKDSAINLKDRATNLKDSAINLKEFHLQWKFSISRIFYDLFCNKTVLFVALTV
jgi:hypothetical protein